MLISPVAQQWLQANQTICEDGDPLDRLRGAEQLLVYAWQRLGASLHGQALTEGLRTAESALQLPGTHDWVRKAAARLQQLKPEEGVAIAAALVKRARSNWDKVLADYNIDLGAGAVTSA